jgi:hypothetical protein
MPATGAQALLDPNWLLIWPGRSRGEFTRVTMEAAAMESSKAGTWATSASPIASRT